MSNFFKKVCIISAIVLIFITGCMFFFFYAYNTFYPQKYRHIIEKKAKEYNIDKYLIASMIHIESRFKPNATSHKGAIGLMQLMPSTAKEIAKKKKIKNYSSDILYNPETNIDFGCYYLSRMLKRTKDPKLALMAYNAGVTNLRKWQNKAKTEKQLMQLAFAETRNYVKDIFTIYQFLNYLKKFNI